MRNVPFIVIDSLAIALVAVPATWQISAWNSGTAYMMLWVVLGCIIHLVNNIVWAGNINNPAPVWCDIASKLIIGIHVALPLTSLCINRRLYQLVTMKAVTVTKGDKKKALIFDTILSILCPMIFMAVHYTMQGHRFDIAEDYGCWPTTYLTPPAVVLVIMPPVVISLVSCVYCILSIRKFVRRRNDFNELLKASPSGINSSRYFRLMALASTEILVGLPAAIFFFVSFIVQNGIHQWISWEDTKWGFSRVAYWPKEKFDQDPIVKASYEMTRWAHPFLAVLFFVFFGLAEDARAHYKSASDKILKSFGITKFASSGTSLKASAMLNGLGSKARPRPTNLSTGVNTVGDSSARAGSGSTVNLHVEKTNQGEMDLPDIDMSALGGGTVSLDPPKYDRHESV